MAPPTAPVAVPPAVILSNHNGVGHFLEPTITQLKAPPSASSVIPIINLKCFNDPLSKASIIEAIDKACSD